MVSFWDFLFYFFLICLCYFFVIVREVKVLMEVRMGVYRNKDGGKNMRFMYVFEFF